MDIWTKLESAWEKRREFARTSDVVRVFDGAGDGQPDLIIDRFGAAALVHLFEGPNLAELDQAIRGAAPRLLDLLSISACVGWVHRRNARESAAGGGELLAGAPTDAVWCREGELKLLVKPLTNVNGGLFLDTREIRAELVRTSGGHRVLNTFCFTGSLGLAAWRGGAREVVQVDISKGILDWARENLAGNGEFPAGGGMRFIAEDSRAFMERELRRVGRGDKERYDTVIIDPPSFGSSRGVTFSFKDDIGGVLKIAFELLKPGGRIFFTTNYRQLSMSELESIAREASCAAGRTLGAAAPLRPPAPDFTAPLAESFAMRGFMLSAV